MRSNLPRLVATVLLIAMALSASADHLVVGVEATDQFPIYRASETESYTGYARELLDSFAAAYGHVLEYRAMPIPRLYAELLDKNAIDLKFPDNPAWKAEARKGKNIAYSEPAVHVTEGAFVLPDKLNQGLTSVATIAAVRGFTPVPYEKQIASGTIRYVEVNSFDSLVRIGLAHRVDAIYANTIVTNYYLAEVLRQPGGLLFDPSLPEMQTDFRVSSIKRPDVIKQFNEYLVSHRTDVARLRAKYSINP